METDNYLSGVFGLMIGGYLIIKSLYRYTKLSKFVENGVETKGLISFVKESYRLVDDDMDDGQTYKTVYYPVVEYLDEEGNELVCELKDEFSTSKNVFQIDSIIELVYNRDRPHLAMKKSTSELGWLHLILLGIGFFICSYSIFMLIEYFNS